MIGGSYAIPLRIAAAGDRQRPLWRSAPPSPTTRPPGLSKSAVPQLDGHRLVALLFVLSAGLLVIYENLASRFCNGQRMGPQDTCSTLTVQLPRSTHTTEKLNPAGTTPAELAPDNWQLDPRQPHTVVYTADGIRGFHRNGGLLWLAIVTAEVLLVGAWVRHRLRSRRSSRADARP